MLPPMLPAPRVPAEEVRKRRRLQPDETRQGERGQPIGDRDSHSLAGPDDALLRRQYVRAPLEQLRRYPERDLRRHGCIGQGRSPGNRARRPPEEDADLVLLDRDLQLRFGNCGPGDGEVGAGLVHFQIGSDAPPGARFEQIERPLPGLGVRLGDLQLEVEGAQLQVSLGHAGNEREHDGPAAVLGGEEVRHRRVARVADAAPEVQLPEQIRGSGVTPRRLRGGVELPGDGPPIGRVDLRG